MKKHIRISADGKKSKRTVCPDGMKASGNSCVPMKSAEKINRKKGARLTKRAKLRNAAKQKLAVRAMKRAMKKRKARGL